MRHLDDALVDSLIGPIDAQHALLAAFRSLGEGRAAMQERVRTEVGGVKLSTLSAVMPDAGFVGAKGALDGAVRRRRPGSRARASDGGCIRTRGDPCL